MLVEIKNQINMIKDEDLKEKVKKFFTDPPSELKAPCLQLEVCPAGAYQHHSYNGGLLQHTVSVVRIALTLSDLVEEVYGGEVDRDVMLAGAILHDVMKCYCYEETADGSYRTSDFGGKVDHLTLVISELMKRDFPQEIVHVVASHHGDVGPTKPKTVEALIVSIADLADSELNGKVLRAAEYLLRRSGVNRPRIVNSKEAIKVILTKDREGWEGVKRLQN
jgi:7,8-dihydroneopterin 2',3'-cyclic phosphate phosphodiesterase